MIMKRFWAYYGEFALSILNEDFSKSNESHYLLFGHLSYFSTGNYEIGMKKIIPSKNKSIINNPVGILYR